MRDLTAALGILLTHEKLRELFVASPEAAATALQVATIDRASFLALSPFQLAQQAQCLIEKRRHEGSAGFAITAQMLGSRTAIFFREYAANAWPQEPHRRWKDLAGFFDFLAERGQRFDPAEANRARFHALAARLSIHCVRRYPIRGALRPALQILWRRGERTGEVGIFFARSARSSARASHSRRSTR